jgi:hypothetical protein
MGNIRSFVQRYWWFGVLLFGFAVAIALRLGSVTLRLFGLELTVDSGWTALALGGLWLAACLWLIAFLDLVNGVIRARFGLGYVDLPGNVQLPHWTLPFLVPVGFVVGMAVGHLWW